MTVSLPYEPGRAAFASLARTADDLTAARRGPDRGATAAGRRDRPALAHLERALFARDPAHARRRARRRAPLPRGRGHRAARSSSSPRRSSGCSATARAAEEIAIVCPTLERWRAPLETAFATLGVPYALEGRLRLGQTPFGQALLSLLRYAWLERRAPRALRLPALAATRAFRAGMSTSSRAACAAAASNGPERVEEEVAKLRGQPLPHLERPARCRRPARRGARARARDAARGLRARGSSDDGDGAARPARLRGRGEARQTSSRAGATSAASSAATRWSRSSSEAQVRLAGAGEAGRVAVLDLLRARTRRFEVVFVARARGGPPAAPLAELAVPRRGAEGRARALVACRPPAAHRSCCARSLPLLHGVHAADAAALPRARGGERRRCAPPAEPLLGRDAWALRRRGGRALDEVPSAGRARRGRWRPRRASASACARWPRSRPLTGRPPRRSPARTAGSGGSSERSAPSTARRS